MNERYEIQRELKKFFEKIVAFCEIYVLINKG